jgi:hypothetical protein
VKKDREELSKPQNNPNNEVEWLPWEQHKWNLTISAAAWNMSEVQLTAELVWKKVHLRLNKSVYFPEKE